MRFQHLFRIHEASIQMANPQCRRWASNYPPRLWLISGLSRHRGRNDARFRRTDMEAWASQNLRLGNWLSPSFPASNIARVHSLSTDPKKRSNRKILKFKPPRPLLRPPGRVDRDQRGRRRRLRCFANFYQGLWAIHSVRVDPCFTSGFITEGGARAPRFNGG